METFGFTKIDTTEHEFARLLRQHKAIDNHQTVANSNQWIGPDGRTVALCIYTGTGGLDCAYWLRTDLMGTTPKVTAESNDGAARARIAEIYREIAEIEARSAARIEALRSELHAIDALIGAQ